MYIYDAGDYLLVEDKLMGIELAQLMLEVDSIYIQKRNSRGIVLSNQNI